LVYNRKEILFNINDIYNIIGIKKSDGESSCLNLTAAVELANAHDAGLAMWLNDAFTRYHINALTAINLKIDDDWTNISDKRVWTP
jgi:hypothetical protein